MKGEFNMKKVGFSISILMILALILIMISDFIYGLVCFILQFLLRGRFHFPHYMLYVILPEVVYTMLLTMVIYPPLKSVTLKLDDLSQGRESSNA